MAALFPDLEALARAFYEEAVRHLADAHCLHGNGSAAGSIASAMKAGELGAKSVLILENALGIYDRTFNTHKPYTEIENHSLLGRLTHGVCFGGFKFAFAKRFRLQSLHRPYIQREAGSVSVQVEYPFLLRLEDGTGGYRAEINHPQTYFTAANSLRYCRIAHELLTALASLEAVIGSWQVILPPRL